MSDSPPQVPWKRTSPFAIVHFIWTTAKGFADGWGRLVTYFGITAVLLRYRRYLAVGVAIGMLTLIVVAGLRWWFFRFRIVEDRIHIREGVVRRTALDIPFDRIQGINVNRRLVERVIGLVTVVIDTPGTLAAEGQLPSVDPEVADQLLRRVEAHRGVKVGASPDVAGTVRRVESAQAEVDETATATGAGAVGGEGSAALDGTGSAVPDKAGVVAPGEAGSAAPGRAGAVDARPGGARSVHILQRLAIADLVRMGLVSPPVLLLALLPVAYGVQLDDWVKAMLGFFETARTAVAGPGILGTVVAAAVLGGGVLILGLAAGIGRKIIRHYGFTVWREGRAFRSREGLFTRRQVAVQIRKMQQLRLDQSLVYRWFRRYRLSCPTIGMALDEEDDGDSGPDADGLVVPFADAEVVEELRSRVFRREGRRLSLLPEAGTFTRVSRYYIRARALRVCFVTLPAGVGTLFVVLYAWLVMVERDMRDSGVEMELAEMADRFSQFFYNWGTASAVWCIACVLLAIPVAWQRWRRRGYMYDDDGLSSRGGLLGYEVEASLFRKAQEVTVKQSPLQRRHGLATLDVGTACGSVTIPYIDHGVACRLQDYVLYKAESSHRHWH